MRWIGWMATGAVLASMGAGAAAAQGRPDPAVLLAAQRQAMAPLAFMDGVWRGTAWTADYSGQTHTLVQTERVGPFLEGAVKVVEGRGYDAEGRLAFNAFATISFNSATKAYTMHSYAQGSVGDFTLTPTADGFVWEIPAGPMTIRYTAVIKDGQLHIQAGAGVHLLCGRFCAGRLSVDQRLCGEARPVTGNVCHRQLPHWRRQPGCERADHNEHDPPLAIYLLGEA